MGFFSIFAIMMNPLFSIVTITWNAGKVIRPTMNSVCEQTFRNFEHILVDGASTDDTLAVAREVGGEEVRIISERDKGLYDAMNKGLRMAKGEYVVFLNAGDAFSSPDTLRLYADSAGEDVDIIYGDTVIVNPAREIVGPRHLSVPEKLTLDSFSHGMLICHQAFMVRRAIAPKYDLSYRFSADYDWTVRCIGATIPERCRNLHAVTIHYLDEGLTERHKKASLRERFDIMAKHYGRGKAVMRHLSFVPRALMRRFKK